MSPECGACGHFVSELSLLLDKRPIPTPKQGKRCPACGGTGTVKVPFTEWHPSGDSRVPEYRVDQQECPDCYFDESLPELDDDA